MLDVAIIGGGPVGLFLALRLARLGLRARVFERRTAPRQESRAIGIHPPALECLAALGLGDTFVEGGIRIRSGLARHRDVTLGTVDFGACPGRFNFIVSLPQQRTEASLCAAIKARDPETLVWGAQLGEVSPERDGVRFGIVRDGATQRLRARFLVGCDGRYSLVRHLLGARFVGRAYPGSYAMADRDDHTDLGPQGAVFLHEHGLVESFPLLEGQRRWVLRRPATHAEHDADLCAAVLRRTGCIVPPDLERRWSTFVAERYAADRIVHDRIILAGDAAHVVSPIGGQGMNLGWLGAWSLGAALRQACDAPRRRDAILLTDALARRKAADRAARRSEAFMWLGLGGRFSSVQRTALRVGLSRSLNATLARVFTMQHRWL